MLEKINLGQLIEKIPVFHVALTIILFAAAILASKLLKKLASKRLGKKAEREDSFWHHFWKAERRLILKSIGLIIWIAFIGAVLFIWSSHIERLFAKLEYLYPPLVKAAFIIIFTIASIMVHSKIGLSFKAIREDQLATETLGLSATKYKLINFTTACFFTGLVGAFYAHYIGILTPDATEFGVPRTVEVLTVAYVGGRGTLWGSMLAGFLLIGFQEYFRELGAWRLVMFGALLIAVMIYAPKGLSTVRRYLW